MGGFILISNPEDLILWEKRIKEKNKSGMSVSEWCKINKITKHKYYYWNNKLKENIDKDKKLDDEMKFTEITSIISNSNELEPNQRKSDDFLILFNNVQVTVPSNFNQDSLAGLMKVLQQL